MNIERRFRSLRLRAVVSPRTQRVRRYLSEIRRRASGRAHVVSVFLQIDDPYSYLLSCYLPDLLSQYDIELRLFLSDARSGEFQPAPEMLAEYALTDCRRIARELGVPFLDKGSSPPTEHRIALTDAVAASVGKECFAEDLREALAIFWRGDSEAAGRRSDVNSNAGKADKVIAAAQQTQWRLGHYNSAMLYYGGEWYWGIDRLHYLCSRLDELGLARSRTPNPQLASIQQTMLLRLPIKPPAAAQALGPIELFHSLRSPYSYLISQRVCDIADAFGIELVIRPVLPMMMRGMAVPGPKLLYIALDTAREARRQGIPFGRLADPLGAGIERSLGVFEYAKTQKRERDFLLNAGVAIWSEAIDVATDAGMRKVTGRTGLFWPDAEAAMKNDDWRAPTDANQEAMMSAGSWGVPTIRMGDFVLWGQDRVWLLARHIEELCDSGDGILV